MGPIWALVRSHRDLRLMMAAGVISMTGDFVLGIGAAYFVYSLTSSTLASAGMMLALFLPSIALSSLAGVFVDRWNRTSTMIATDLLRAVGLLPLLLVHDTGTVWIVYAVTTWDGIVKLFFAPAEQAMLPRLVDDDELPTANALNGQIRDVARLIGAAIGGVVVATGGLSALALGNMATFLLSAVLIARMTTSGAVRSSTAGPAKPALTAMPASRFRTLFGEWSDGIRLLVSEPALRVILIFTLIAMTGEGIMGALFVPFVRDELHGSGGAYGLIVSVQAVGGLVGGVLAASIGQRVPAARMFGFGAMIFGLIDLTMFVYPLAFVAVWPAVACMVVVGLPGAVMMAGYNTLIQRGTSDAIRGRVFGALGSAVGIGVVTGTVSAGFLGESVGIIPILALDGFAFILSGVVIVTALRRYEPPADVAVESVPSSSSTTF